MTSFIRRQLVGIVLFHLLMLLIVGYTLPAYANQQPDQVWTYYTGSEPPSWFRPAAKYIGTLSFGLAGWAGLEIAYRLLSLSMLAYTAAARAVLSADYAPEPFVLSDYAPLTGRAYARTSVYDFWTFGWHWSVSLSSALAARVDRDAAC